MGIAIAENLVEGAAGVGGAAARAAENVGYQTVKAGLGTGTKKLLATTAAGVAAAGFLSAPDLAAPDLTPAKAHPNQLAMIQALKDAEGFIK